MEFQSQKYINDILFTAKLLFGKIESENELGYFDDNRAIQGFFARFFSIIYGYTDLVEMDKENKISNFPAIDLGSVSTSSAFQISSQTGATKIQDTIDTFVKYDLYKKYTRLVFVIFSKEKLRKSAFNTGDKFTFTPADDIWDIDTLTDIIKAIDDIDKINKLYELFCKELPNIVNFGHTISPQDFKESIEFLSKELGISGNEPILVPDVPDRSSFTYMFDKNKLNGINEDIYRKCIRPAILYSKSLGDFLGDPINRKLLVKYWGCCERISKEKDSLLTDRIDKLCKSIPRYSLVIGVSGDTLALVLHNMYFCCDIGINP